MGTMEIVSGDPFAVGILDDKRKNDVLLALNLKRAFLGYIWASRDIFESMTVRERESGVEKLCLSNSQRQRFKREIDDFVEFILQYGFSFF